MEEQPLLPLLPSLASSRNASICALRDDRGREIPQIRPQTRQRYWRRSHRHNLVGLRYIFRICECEIKSLTNWWGEAWQRRESALRGALAQHEAGSY